ncbi:MAG: deoxycytidylate deaminase [Anaerolineae bacterium]
MPEIDRPDIDTYFMRIAGMVATRATCLHRRVGAVIVRGKQIVSTGYNGAAAGHPHCLEIGCAREGVPSGQNMELCRAAHAEQNAINFAARYGIAIEGASLYTTHHPCSACAKSIINAGIVRVVYEVDYPDPLAKQVLSIIVVEQWERQ